MRLNLFATTAAAAALILAVAPSAMAQRGRNQGGDLVVVNYQRVANESALGRDMAAKLSQIQSQVASEAQALAPEQQSLEQEGQRLQQTLRNQSEEQIRGNAQVQQYQQRARAFEARRSALRGDYECSEAIALRDFGNLVQPVIESAMRARNASVVLDSGAVRFVAPESDITTTVIQQLDQNPATRVSNASRHPVAECRPQQQPANR